MWTKEEKDYIHKHYDFVKAGEKGTEAAVLMAKLKGSDIKKAVPVLVCNEEVDNYEFVKPCPFCGEHHLHGNKPGFRAHHCNNARFKLLASIYQNIGDYLIANKQEYDEMWNWAEEVF